MVKHNNAIATNHNRKHTSRSRLSMIRTWFDQPAKKLKRRNLRAAKAAADAPRPAGGLLRPQVQAPTKRYAAKTRFGRGFTLDELKGAGVVNAAYARSIGIAVDSRRVNRSQETYAANVERLKTYTAKLVLFPRKAGKAVKGDSDEATCAAATQVKTRHTLPLVKAADEEIEARAITEEEKKGSAYLKIHNAFHHERQIGRRKKLAKEAAEKAAAAAAAGAKGKGKK